MLQPRDFPETRPSLLATLREDEPAQSAWREFFERYAPAVFRIARLRGLADADADDIVQQAMLAVSSHIGHFDYDADRGRFRQWMRRIAESKISDLRRRRPLPSEHREDLDDRPDERPGLDEAWEQEWRLQDMLWCLDQIARDIAPRRVEAFRMYVLEDVPAVEVARRLGMSTTHVYVTRYYMLGLIRRRLEKLEATGD